MIIWYSFWRWASPVYWSTVSIFCSKWKRPWRYEQQLFHQESNWYETFENIVQLLIQYHFVEWYNYREFKLDLYLWQDQYYANVFTLEHQLYCKRARYAMCHTTGIADIVVWKRPHNGVFILFGNGTGTGYKWVVWHCEEAWHYTLTATGTGICCVYCFRSCSDPISVQCV